MWFISVLTAVTVYLSRPRADKLSGIIQENKQHRSVFGRAVLGISDELYHFIKKSLTGEINAVNRFVAVS